MKKLKNYNQNMETNNKYKRKKPKSEKNILKIKIINKMKWINSIMMKMSWIN